MVDHNPTMTLKKWINGEDKTENKLKIDTRIKIWNDRHILSTIESLE